MPFDKKGFLGEEIELYKKDHREKLKNLFWALGELNEVGNVLLEHLRIRTGNLQEVTCASLLLRSMSSFSAGFKLVELGLKIDAGTVIRSQVEATIYLKACCDSEIFCEQFHNSSNVFRLKIVNLLLTGTNAPFEPDEENRLKMHKDKERLEKLKTEGTLKDINLAVVARQFGMIQMYNTAYR